MFNLKTSLLLEVYEEAIEMKLERDFILIIESELLRRGEQICQTSGTTLVRRT